MSTENNSNKPCEPLHGPSSPPGALLGMLVCPLCKGPLCVHLGQNAQGNPEKTHLLCAADQLAFPIHNGIPIMLPEQALPLSTLHLPSKPTPLSF